MAQIPNDDSGTSASKGFASQERTKISIVIALVALLIGFAWKYEWVTWGNSNPPSERAWEMVNLSDKNVKTERLIITFSGNKMSWYSYPMQNGIQCYTHAEATRADTLDYTENMTVVCPGTAPVRAINHYRFGKTATGKWLGTGTIRNTRGGLDAVQLSPS